MSNYVAANNTLRVMPAKNHQIVHTVNKICYLHRICGIINMLPLSGVGKQRGDQRGEGVSDPVRHKQGVQKSEDRKSLPESLIEKHQEADGWEDLLFPGQGVQEGWWQNSLHQMELGQKGQDHLLPDKDQVAEI